MRLKKIIPVLLLLFIFGKVVAQKDTLTQKKHVKVKKQQKFKTNFDPLKPAKAAFFSAIFPGMGQVYNRKYWKTPIVWGGLYIPYYYFSINNRDYKRYRTAFKLREYGLQDEFTLDDGTEIISTEGLISAQKQLRTNRDLSLFTLGLLYILQVVEASVNAHLLQFNTTDDLSLTPTFVQDPMQIDAPKIGFTLKYSF